MLISIMFIKQVSLHDILDCELFIFSYFPSVLDNIFQKNVLLKPPILKERHIDTHFEFKSLIKNYSQLVELGNPNMTQSDECLAAFSTLDSKCEVSQDCLDLMISDLPTYGYKRMHQ